MRGYSGKHMLFKRTLCPRTDNTHLKPSTGKPRQECQSLRTTGRPNELQASSGPAPGPLLAPSQNKHMHDALQTVLPFNFRKQILTTGMEISTPEGILMFLRSHHPQTGPLRSSRKPCLDCLQGMVGEDKFVLLSSTSAHFRVILVRPCIPFGSL